MQPHIELRSDTFTKPSAAMLQAIMEAKVGDDVFEEDETTNILEATCASLFGYEAALLCTSGTMANQVAITVHCQAGDEVICDAMSHIYVYEGGGIMANARASVNMLVGDRGRITATQIAAAVKPDNVHFPVSKIVSLENTMNKGGGACYDIVALEKIKKVCLAHNMQLHLDGARLYNALIATNTTPLQHGAIFDSITICFSKGLGTPMGTVLLGNKKFIHAARRVRKRFGGGWRQSGYMAAACLYALEHNVNRLLQDHERAKQLGKMLEKNSAVKNIVPIETNLVFVEFDETILAADIVNKWEAQGLKCMSLNKHSIRLVTHLDFTDDDLTRCEKILMGN
jgi:threonine aldolase